VRISVLIRSNRNTVLCSTPFSSSKCSYKTYVQDNKLFIKGVASSEDAKNAVWDQIKLVDQNNDQDLTCEIDVDESKAQQGGGGGDQQQGGESYTVQAGDTLSKISKQFYGDSNEFMRIYYANQGTLVTLTRFASGRNSLFRLVIRKVI
jgi:LysM repeat protein